MLLVVAALIESEGKLLVCQRRRNDSFPMMWEFPGGKARPDESLAAALERELEEELGVKSRIGPEVYRTHHQYAELREPIELVFFKVELDANKVRNLNFEQIEWREPSTLPELNFLPADHELIVKLSTGTLRLP